VAGYCPCCKGPLVVEPRVVPWCAACEWNLGAYDHRHAVARWRWRLMGRIDHRVAFRLNASALARVGTEPPTRHAGRLARIVLPAVALPVLALSPACLALAAYLVATGLPSGPVLAVFLVVLALLIRPRVPRLSRDAWVMERSSAPKLFGLLDQIAAAANAPVPHTVVLYLGTNAFVGVLGLRRRLLAIGLPLWAGLAPQQRVALLAHEMGHLVNHDIRRGRTVGLARCTLSELLHFLNLLAVMTAWILSPILLPLAAPLWLANVLLLLIGQRDGQRAEYLADEVAATVAGTDASPNGSRLRSATACPCFGNGLSATVLHWSMPEPHAPDASRAVPTLAQFQARAAAARTPHQKAVSSAPPSRRRPWNVRPLSSRWTQPSAMLPSQNAWATSAISSSRATRLLQALSLQPEARLLVPDGRR
jgi:heat shock protein HtpX